MTTEDAIDALRRAIAEVQASDGRLVFVRLTTGEANGIAAEVQRLREQVAHLERQALRARRAAPGVH